MTNIACIFARSGSKGISNKNIRAFNGKPLIAWTVELALKVKQIDQVYVSTDSEEIANVAASVGAIVPFIRPPELATDTSPELHSWQHFLQNLAEKNGKLPDVFVSLPTTSPLRSIQDVENCISEFNKGLADLVLGISPSNRSPFFNMVKKDKNNFVDLVMAGETQFTRRQDALRIFDITTICYVGDPSFILSTKSIFDGRIIGVEIPAERAIDIDTPLDFKIAQFLHQNIRII